MPLTQTRTLTLPGSASAIYPLVAPLHGLHLLPLSSPSPSSAQQFAGNRTSFCAQEDCSRQSLMRRGRTDGGREEAKTPRCRSGSPKGAKSKVGGAACILLASFMLLLLSAVLFLVFEAEQQRSSTESRWGRIRKKVQEQVRLLLWPMLLLLCRMNLLVSARAIELSAGEIYY